jgi:hypothetical protein
MSQVETTTDLVSMIIDDNKNIEGIEQFAEVAVEALGFMPQEKLLFYSNTFIRNNKMYGSTIDGIDLDTLVEIRKGWLSVMKKASRERDYKKMYYAGLSLNLAGIFIAAYRNLQDEYLS